MKAYEKYFEAFGAVGQQLAEHALANQSNQSEGKLYSLSHEEGFSRNRTEVAKAHKVFIESAIDTGISYALDHFSGDEIALLIGVADILDSRGQYNRLVKQGRTTVSFTDFEKSVRENQPLLPMVRLESFVEKVMRHSRPVADKFLRLHPASQIDILDWAERLRFKIGEMSRNILVDRAV